MIEPSRLRMIVQRFLIPAFAVSFLYFLRYGAKISLRAEVELTPNLVLGRGAVIGSFTKVKATNGVLRIGERGGIATGCFIGSGSAGVEIGDNFVCGPNVNIVGVNYITEKLDVHFADQGVTSRGIRIGRNVWIGAGSTILDGTVIGDNTIVVANSLVNRRFPANSVLQGNPAKVIYKRG